MTLKSMLISSEFSFKSVTLKIVAELINILQKYCISMNRTALNTHRK